MKMVAENVLPMNISNQPTRVWVTPRNMTGAVLADAMGLAAAVEVAYTGR
jgi:hypothetical protein